MICFRYPDALPMYGLYDAGCGKSELSGPCDGPTTAPRQWRCYSHLAVVSDAKSNYSHSWSNDTKHPNAYCSESGPALAKLSVNAFEHKFFVDSLRRPISTT